MTMCSVLIRLFVEGGAILFFNAVEQSRMS